MRGLADRYADALAPGLSNGTADARWVSLLAWCLKASHDVWARAEGGTLRTREAQRRRYAWMRPLELLWVAWALHTDGSPVGRQLPGQRAVRRWVDGDARAPRFGMRPDQYRRYRQTGAYGTYRTLLRRVPGLTQGVRGPDGWTPYEGALALYRYVNAALPRSARFADAILDDRTHWRAWQGEEERWWAKRGWGLDTATAAHLLPTRLDSATRLPEEERGLLRHYLFGMGHRRQLVAEALADIAPGLQHVDVCDHLARTRTLKDSEAGPLLATLPAFTRLADAGLDAMHAVWAAVGRAGEAAGPHVADVASVPDVRQTLRRLGESARLWAARNDTAALPAGVAAAALASALAATREPSQGLRVLVQHHESYGGGLKWLRLRKGRVEPLLPQETAAASPYRFRLWPLSRLAYQCGAADTRAALEATRTWGDADEEAAE